MYDEELEKALKELEEAWGALMEPLTLAIDKFMIAV